MGKMKELMIAEMNEQESTALYCGCLTGPSGQYGEYRPAKPEDAVAECNIVVTVSHGDRMFRHELGTKLVAASDLRHVAACEIGYATGRITAMIDGEHEQPGSSELVNAMLGDMGPTW